MSKLRFAFTGFRHGHVFSLYNLARSRDDIELVAACEEHEPTRRELAENGRAEITHHSFDQMLDEVDCDVIGVGEYFGKRGTAGIRALEAGKHLIVDKPLCTRSTEIDRIEELARENGLSVGCQFSVRGLAHFRKARELLLAGEIGEIHAIAFGGQHPLNLQARAPWYFEEGKHGGTLNDIAIHAVDYLPWATGLKFTHVNAARNWNAAAKEYPDFRDAAQCLLTMQNGCGVIGDVSYLLPANPDASKALYWRITFWGQTGVLEVTIQGKSVTLYRSGGEGREEIPGEEARPNSYLEDFLAEIRGETGLELTTSTVIESSRNAIKIQEAADQALTNVPL